jgi:hypothetical protein
MKVLRIVAAFAIACWLSNASDVFAKGAGGGHGSGGHSSGGHASGGHASGGHASGGRSSGGHTSGSHAGTTPHGNAVPRASGAGQSSGSVHTAVQRPSVSTPFVTSSPLRYLPSRIIWPAYSTVLGFGAFGLASDPFWPFYGNAYGPASYPYGYGSAWPYSEYGGTFDDFDDAGSLRLQVEPKGAQVYGRRILRGACGRLRWTLPALGSVAARSSRGDLCARLSATRLRRRDPVAS